MKNLKISKNPFLLFLPFLFIYVAIALIIPTNGTLGDEGRYIEFSNNLLNGFYSVSGPAINLPCGPGYPIILIPFVFLGLPLISITIMNGIFYYLSVVFLFKSIKLISSFNYALIFSLFWACFFNLYEYLPIIYTETFTSFLITMFVFSLLKSFKLPHLSNLYLYLSGFFLGYLALTKIVFGYVIAFLFLGYGIFWLIKQKHNINYKKSFLIIFIAFLVTSPYLIYTISLTGKVFYWGTNGGNNLYWMSTPYKGEYGNWIEFPFEYKKTRTVKGSNLIRTNHEKVLNQVDHLDAVAKDDTLKEIAVKNIKSYPVKFLQNWFSNIGRILFNFPYSYKLEKPGTLLRLPLNGIIVVLSLFCLIPTFRNWTKLFFPIRFLFWITFLYLGACTLGSAETRMFTMAVPVLLLWIAYILPKSIKIKLKFDQNSLYD